MVSRVCFAGPTQPAKQRAERHDRLGVRGQVIDLPAELVGQPHVVGVEEGHETPDGVPGPTIS